MCHRATGVRQHLSFAKFGLAVRSYRSKYGRATAYVIAEPCIGVKGIGVKDTACVPVCPVREIFALDRISPHKLEGIR